LATISTPYGLPTTKAHTPQSDLAEIIFGFGLIMLIIWLPARAQAILSPVALVATLSLVLWYRPSRDNLGLSISSFVPSLWILPAGAALTLISIFIAQKLGTLHPLYQPDFSHVAGYVLWTCYQQFLLQDYFTPRLSRLFASDSVAVTITAVLFAAAHLPNLALTAVTLVWGAASCLLFLRYRNLYVLGLAQGLLGLCFAVCVPDVFHHHMRVGLGYLHYQALPIH
jgi:membrane protease YdiL (CAAX protease family)